MAEMQPWHSAEERVELARRALEPAEVLHPLMLDVAEELQRAGQVDAAARVRQTARTLLPMFGMRQPKPRWPWSRPVLIDYSARVESYRRG